MDWKPLLKDLTLSESIKLRGMLTGRLNQFEKELKAALPKKLREKYGYYDALSNMAYNGGCSYTLFEDVGLNLQKGELEEFYRKGAEIISPVLKAWARFGIKLHMFYYHRANNGIISVGLKVK
jgi:hypothetical protein